MPLFEVMCVHVCVVSFLLFEWRFGSAGGDADADRHHLARYNQTKTLSPKKQSPQPFPY